MEGSIGQINVGKYRQLLDYIEDEAAESGITVKGILVGNGFRLEPPSNRGDQFTEACKPRQISLVLPHTGPPPHLTVHGLRHAHATMLLEEGFNPKIVSERLGHATIATTMDIYSHALPGMQEAAALAVAAKLSRN